MPPAISEDESDGVDVPETVPAKASKGKQPVEPEEDDEDDEQDEDEFLVDEIVDHGFEADGSVKYKVKWLGYENEEDMTWEPVENLETASEKLNDYHDKIGGEPVFAPASKGKKKSSKVRTASEALDSPAPSSSKKRGRKSQTNGAAAAEADDTPLPKGSWESEVSHVMSIVEEEKDSDTKRGASAVKTLTGYIQWNSGRKTKHPLKTLRGKCPQALLTYYENHLRFG